MSAYTDFQKFVNDLEASSTFKNWCSNQAADCTAWKTYRTGLLTLTPPPGPPSMSTSFGKAIVDVGVMAVDAGLVAPPPPQPIKAAFTFSTNALTASFTDASTPGPSGPIAAWLWDFGDGKTSNAQNPPPHTYAAPGTYTVRLTVTGSGSDGTATTTIPVTVASSPPPPPPPPSGGTPGIGILVYNNLSKITASLPRYATVIGTLTDVPTLVNPTYVKGRALVYMAAEDVQTGSSSPPAYGVTYQQALANGWLLKDSSGNYCLNKSYPDYIGDVGAVGYQNAWISNVLAYLGAHPGLDGVFIDDVTWDPRAICGVFPAKYPTTAAWAAAMLAFCTAVHTALSAHGYYVALNASAYISGDSRYTDGTLDNNWWAQLGPHCDGLMNEYYCEGNASLPPRKLGPEWYNNWAGWQRLIGTAQSHGADFIGFMKGLVGSTATAAFQMYGKASFLMEWDGGGGIFMYGISKSATDPTSSAWTTDIGAPTAAKVAVGVGYIRHFAAGVAIINPSPSGSQAFSLGGTYHEPNGTAVSSVTLAPGTAMILTA